MVKTFAEERTEQVREECLKRDEEYRRKHNIPKDQIYYHKEENTWRPDYLILHLS